MSETDAPLQFIGSSRDDLSGFPLHAKKEIGLALRAAQKGGKADNAKPLKGFGGAQVLQITSNLAGNTYRTVYTVQLKGVIYVLHAFQKKSTQGIKTSVNDINKIKARLKTAIELHAER
jgi:phage-related protein